MMTETSWILLALMVGIYSVISVRLAQVPVCAVKTDDAVDWRYNLATRFHNSRYFCMMFSLGITWRYSALVSFSLALIALLLEYLVYIRNFRRGVAKLFYERDRNIPMRPCTRSGYTPRRGNAFYPGGAVATVSAERAPSCCVGSNDNPLCNSSIG